MIRRLAIVSATFVALTMAMTWPVWADPSGLRMGGGADPSLYVWTIGWDTWALTHRPWAIFDANIFFPHPLTLAYSEHLIGSALLALPISWLGADAQAATNLVSLLTVVLCGVGGWWLGRAVGLSHGAALVCGVVFAFAPPRFARLAQLHLTAVQWVPFTFAFVLRYQEHGRARDLRWALVCFSLQALSSGHGAALLLLGLAILTAFRLAQGWPFAPMTWLRDGGIRGALALLPAVLSFIPYWLARRDVALERIHDDVGVTAISYLSSPSWVHQALRRLLPEWDWTRLEPDAFLFPGVLTLVFAALAIERRSRQWWPWLTMVVVTWWMTIGPPWSLWGLVYWMPGLNFIRVPSRFTILGVLALAVLAGWGFDRLTRNWPTRRRQLAAVAGGLLLLAEFAMPIDARPFTDDVTAVDRWLDTQPKPFAVAEVPVSGSRDASRRADVAVMYMRHSLAHHQPTVFGYSGAEPDDYPGVYDDLNMFPSVESINHLKARGVTYVVAHLEFFTDEARPAYVARLAEFADRLQLVHEDGHGRVYRLK